jgi:signal transduction histidine kinase
LSAINAALSGVSGIGEDRLSLIKNASRRINTIAEDLLKKSKNREEFELHENYNSEFSSPINIVQCISEVTSEKHQLFAFVEIDIGSLTEKVLVFADQSGLERVLSNLIQNAIEAVIKVEKPMIQISLRNYGAKVQVAITDNGNGISAELLKKIGVVGFTHGKENGNGFGLSYAKKKMEEWGGQLHIASELEVGTMVTLVFKGVVN